jgi:DNA-binding transcriptional ArsR family regulator
LFGALDGRGQLLYLTYWLFNRMAKLSLDTAFAALSDPTRRAILARLALGETSVTELAKPFAMSLPAVSKHLKVLERAGLIARGREAQWRPCRIEPRALKDIDDWLNHYRRFFDESFDRLDAYLQKLQAQGQDKDRDQKGIEERSNDQSNAKNRKDRRNKQRRS